MSSKKSLVAFSAALLLLLSSVPALAQQRNLTIQLPVVRQFSVDTRVMVPDGGTMVIGGGSSSASSVVSRGTGFGRPFGNRSSGSRTSSGQASVSVGVLSNREINDAILSGASPVGPPPKPYYQEVWERQRSLRASQQK